MIYKRFEEDDTKEWDDFVFHKARNASFLHSRRYLSHETKNQSEDFSWMFYQKHRLVAIFPAVLASQGSTKQLISHFRLTYGGFVFDESVGTKEAKTIVSDLLEIAKSASVKQILIRNPFRIYNQIQSDEFDYALWFHGFEIHARMIECCITLDRHCFSRISTHLSRILRKKKAIECSFSEQIPAFYEILLNNLQKKYQVQPTHSLEQLLFLQRQFPEQIKLVSVCKHSEMIAGILIFLHKNVIHTQYIARNDAFDSENPLHHLIAFLMSWGAQNDFQYLNLGSVNEQQGRVLNEGLLQFKESFGARALLRETMIYTFRDETCQKF